jgi:hypothetical protein
LDVDALEDAAKCSLDELATRASSDPLVRIRDHQDIVDERRKAPCALSDDVKFRWQIASDRYSIINPQPHHAPLRVLQLLREIWVVCYCTKDLYYFESWSDI